jgi:hypothetical protein
LTERNIVGLGTECPNVDLRQHGNVKRILAQKGKFSVVQLANLDKLPPRGFSLTIAPLKLRNGSGGPTRVFAFPELKKHHPKKNHQGHQKNHEKNDFFDKTELCANYDHANENVVVKKRPAEAYNSSAIRTIRHDYMPKILIIISLMYNSLIN